MKKIIITSLTLLTAGALLGGTLVGCGKQPSVPDTPPQVTTVESETETETTPTDSTASFDWECECGILPDDAQEAFDQAFSQFLGSDVEPIALLGTQLVAGTNYAILCKVTPVVPDAISAMKVVTIYKDLHGNSTLLGFVDFDMDALYNANSGQTQGAGLLGGWQEQVYGNDIPEDVLSYIDTNGRTPLAYIGYNPTRSRHAVLCEDPLQIGFIDLTKKDADKVFPSAKYISFSIADYANYGEADE